MEFIFDFTIPFPSAHNPTFTRPLAVELLPRNEVERAKAERVMGRVQCVVRRIFVAFFFLTFTFTLYC